jgi:paraquat-inducible protein B
MAKKKTYKTVGLFVLLGFICLGAIIFHYTTQKFFEDDADVAVMYFEESINGLSVGSSVVFKGVEVGKVSKINLVFNMDDGTFKTPVFARFQENKAFKVVGYDYKNPEEQYKKLIEKGLRAKLVSASLLTGQLMIELEMNPDSPAEFEGDGKYAEIPTEMSSIGVISKDLQEIPLKETMLRLSDIVNKVDQGMPEIMDTLSNKLPRILTNMEQITKKMNSAIDQKSHETSKAMSNFNATMEDMGKASVSIKNLVDYLERHPESLIRGKEDKQ